MKILNQASQCHSQNPKTDTRCLCYTNLFGSQNLDECFFCDEVRIWSVKENTFVWPLCGYFLLKLYMYWCVLMVDFMQTLVQLCYCMTSLSDISTVTNLAMFHYQHLMLLAYVSLGFACLVSSSIAMSQSPSASWERKGLVTGSVLEMEQVCSNYVHFLLINVMLVSTDTLDTFLDWTGIKAEYFDLTWRKEQKLKKRA
jgi:hypothetical protein